MAASHVQVSPDSTGKDVDADALTSTESGTPTVYRQVMVVADPVAYANKASVSAAGALKVAGEAPGTGTKTSVAAAVTSTTLLAANLLRKQAVFMNDSTANLFLDLAGGTASTASYSVKVPAGGYYEIPWPVYTGLVTGIWDAAAGSAQITELS